MTYIDDTVDLAGALDETFQPGGVLADLGFARQRSQHAIAHDVNKTVGTMALDMVLGGHLAIPTPPSRYFRSPHFAWLGTSHRRGRV